MSVFRSFDQNPFLVNAFTIAGESVAEVDGATIYEHIASRREIVAAGEEIRIPAGRGREHAIQLAELTRAEEDLRDPHKRIAEELLAPEPHSPRSIPQIREFCAAHALGRSAAQSLLSLVPLDGRTLLLRELPEIPRARLQLEASGDAAELPAPAPLEVRAAQLLIRARHRRA